MYTTNLHNDFIDANEYFLTCPQEFLCPVGWGCKIHRQQLCRRGKIPTTNECPRYDIKHSDSQ